MPKNILKKINKYILDKEYRVRVNSKLGLYKNLDDKKFIEKMFAVTMKYPLNLEKPETFNEKLQWLKLYDRNPLYTKLVDKYKVREYIAKKIGEEYLIPLLGVWDDPSDIDFDILPNKFVLKCNHNSGLGMCICTDKSKLDINKVKNELKKGLEQDYYLNGREWPYKNVPRKIICEKYMANDSAEGLDDYKFYCFDGQVKLLGIFQGRNTDRLTTGDFFDRNYEWQNMKYGYPNSKQKPKKPNKFEEMVKLAEILSEGFAEIRVDLYLCGEKIYFGELTFFDGGGFDEIEPVDWDYKLGSYINLENLNKS